MSKIPTQHAQKLAIALMARGLEIQTEYWDGHKHVDLYVPAGRLYLEVDGTPHYTLPKQLIADFKRDYFSFKEGFLTKHITNEAIDSHLDEIADAITFVVNEGPIQPEAVSP